MKFLGLAAIVAATLDAQPLAPKAEQFIEERFTAAKLAEASSDFPRAIAEYESIVARYPKAVPEVYQNLGLAYYLSQRCPDAIRAFERGLALKPSMSGARLFLGVCHLEAGRPQQALPHLELAHKAQPSPESAAHLGLALHALRRYARAASLFRESLDRSDRKDQLLYLLGESYLKLSEQVADSLTARYPDSKYEYYIVAKVVDGQQWNQIAAKEYLEAAKRDPMNASLFFPLARWLAVVGLDQPSQLAFERYRALMPGDRAARINAGDLARKPMADVGITVDYEAELKAMPAVASGREPLLAMFTGEVNEAARARLAADTSGRWKRVIAAFAGSEWKAATAELEAIKPGPRDWLRDYLLASVLVWLEDTAGAEKAATRIEPFAPGRPWISVLRWDIYRQLSFHHLQKLLEDYPRSAWAHLVKGRTLDMQGKREALDEYKAALERDPSLPGLRIAIADFHLANSSFEEALAECTRELELHPSSVAARMRAGKIYVEMRQPDKGIPMLLEALKADPADANAHFDLGRGHELRDDLPAALASYQRALHLDPGMNRLRYVLARLYRRMGKPELAAREYRLFQQNEAGARQQYQERLRRLRESGPVVEER